MDVLNPSGWAAPKGYANVIRVPAGAERVYVAGQIAWDAEQRLVGVGDFPAQFRQALENVVTCLRTADTPPSGLVSMTVYVTDKQAYVASAKQLGAIWKEVVGRHWPTMALVEVADLLEEGALVEIQAVAVRPLEQGP